MDRETSRPRFDDVPQMTAADLQEFQAMQDTTWDKLFEDIPWYCPLRWWLFLLSRTWVQSRSRLRQWVVARTEATKGYKVRKRTFEEM